MNILVVNDDGYAAAGIAALERVAADFGEVVVVAPLSNCSGASSALTINGDIRLVQKGERRYVVDGTPADCVHLAMTGDFLPAPPDLIVSGINDGANLGDDTIYSGTVAAAIEGHLFRVPAIAFSMAGKSGKHFDAGAAVARRVLERIDRAPPVGAFLLNINVPDAPPSQLRGIRATRLGRRHVAQPAWRKSSDGDAAIFAIGAAGEGKDAAAGTDFQAVEEGYASVTPLTVDMTAYWQAFEVDQWLR